MTLILWLLAQANADAALVAARSWDQAHCQSFNEPAWCEANPNEVRCEPSLKAQVDCTWIGGHSPVALACGGIFANPECTD